jgi:hypothetical protein
MARAERASRGVHNDTVKREGARNRGRGNESDGNQRREEIIKLISAKNKNLQ